MPRPGRREPRQRRRTPRVAGAHRPLRRHSGGAADDRSAISWILRYAVPLAGLGSAAIYGVLRLSLALFYLHLRATPEEAGYDYTEILAGQLIGALELVVLLALLILGATILVRALALGLRRAVGRPRRHSPSERVPTRTMAVRSVVAALVVVGVSLPALAWEEGAEAAVGQTKRNIYLRPLPISVLPVQAVPATASPLGETSEATADIEERECLLYLGQADGTAVFYDVSTGESLRLSADAFVITLQRTASVPIGC